MRLLLNLLTCPYCPGLAVADRDHDAGLELLWHMADAHPERFGMDRVRREYARRMWERRN